MFVRLFAIFTSLILACPGLSAATLKNFRFVAVDQFELVVEMNGVPLTFSSQLQGTQATQVKVGAATAQVQALSAEWLVIAVGADAETVRSLFILQKQNEIWTPQNLHAIRAKRSTTLNEFLESLTYLERTKHVGLAQAAHAAAVYFNNNPERTVSDFFDQVELGALSLELPRPRRDEPPRTKQPIEPPPSQSLPSTPQPTVEPLDVPVTPSYPAPTYSAPPRPDSYQPDLRPPRLRRRGDPARLREIDEYFRKNFGPEDAP